MKKEKKENKKIEQNQATFNNFSEEKLEKAAGYFLAIIWAIALTMGLGFDSWVMLFVSMILTFGYLLKINGISGGSSAYESSLNKHHNGSSLSDHSIRPIGHDRSSAAGLNASRSYITNPSYYYLPNNIYNRR